MNDLGRLGSFGLAAAASLALAIESFSQEFNSARVAAVLLAVLVLHLVRCPRVIILREAVIYACFIAYMLIELLWTTDRALAMNTLAPALTSLITLVLFGSFAALHDLRAVVAGSLAGFLAGAAVYAGISGFPFRYPAGFSYNAVAGMYLFGLILALLLASCARRKALLLVLSAVIGAHVVATTSIKTNLGILLGAIAAALIHFAYVSRLLWRNALVVLALGTALTIVVASNESAVGMLKGGAERVALGLQILKAREDMPGYTAFEKRASWQREGFRGWSSNPVFGHGVESFRSRFGFTSHASHVDIAYNSGLIGLILFYGVFASVFHRLYRARNGEYRDARFVILAGTICYVFISFAGTIHYISTLAAFIALGAGFLKRA